MRRAAYLFWCFFMTLFINEIQGQSHFFSGRVVTPDSISGIGYAHIINRTKHLGTVANPGGFFSITANTGDEIFVSALGFFEKSFRVDSGHLSKGYTITLTEQIYPLDEVRVFRFNDYASFRREFLREVPVEDTLFRNIPPPLDGYSVNRPEWGAGITLNSPVTSLYNLLSREGRAFRQYLNILNGTDDNLVIAQKFNGVIVRSLTGLEGEDLIRFISYCNFGKQYLLYASQQEIQRAILRHYDLFRKGI